MEDLCGVFWRGEFVKCRAIEKGIPQRLKPLHLEADRRDPRLKPWGT
jgi:hypothetical protein